MIHQTNKCICLESRYLCDYTCSSDFTSSASGRTADETIDPILDLCARYPLQMGGPRQCGIRSLPGTSTHDYHWESNPRPSDLESNALSTWSHAPTKRTCLILVPLFINDTNSLLIHIYYFPVGSNGRDLCGSI